MSVQLPIWDLPAPPRRRRRWVPRCEDCKRRIWAEKSLRRRLGKILGEGCYRKRRRLVVPVTIGVRDPGHIPGQGEIPLPGSGT